MNNSSVLGFPSSNFNITIVSPSLSISFFGSRPTTSFPGTFPDCTPTNAAGTCTFTIDATGNLFPAGQTQGVSVTYNGTTYGGLQIPIPYNFTLDVTFSGAPVTVPSTLNGSTISASFSDAPFTFSAVASLGNQNTTIFSNLLLTGSGTVGGGGTEQVHTPGSPVGDIGGQRTYAFQDTPETSSVVLTGTGLGGLFFVAAFRLRKRSA